jgi:hypothetical protein
MFPFRKGCITLYAMAMYIVYVSNCFFNQDNFVNTEKIYTVEIVRLADKKRIILTNRSEIVNLFSNFLMRRHRKLIKFLPEYRIEYSDKLKDYNMLCSEKYCKEKGHTYVMESNISELIEKMFLLEKKESH